MVTKYPYFVVLKFFVILIKFFNILLGNEPDFTRREQILEDVEELYLCNYILILEIIILLSLIYIYMMPQQEKFLVKLLLG
jgi:hypothetical protein